MFLREFRRVGRPIAVVITATFLSTMLPARRAEAADESIAPGRGTGGASTLAGPSAQAENANALASVDSATGSARASLPFELPRARGAAQPALGLSYSSNSGVGYAGVGWTLDLPSIERKGVAGRPRYQDNMAPTNSEFAQDDRYLFNHKPLVAICTLDGAANCDHALAGERFPTKLAGWTYYRSEVDDSVRVFFAPSGQSWLAQTHDGQELLFGQSISGDGAKSALEIADNTLPHPDATPTRIHRWNLIEQTDASLNTVYYVWDHLQTKPHATSVLFLTDIYDTAPPKQQGVFDPNIFAHHTHLRWSDPDGSAISMSRTPIWRAQPTLRLLGVDVTSSPPSGSGSRELVRRYHLDYDWNATQTRASLSSFQLEGRCGNFVEGATGELPAQTGCPRQPATTMAYTQMKGLPTPITRQFSASAGQIALLDVNGDAVPEILSFVPDATPAGIGTDATGNGTSLGTISLPSNPGRFATLADLAPGAKRLIYGDWMGDGRLNWLWLNINPPSINGLYPSLTYELYSYDRSAAGGLRGIGPVPLDVDPNIVDSSIRVPVLLGHYNATSAQALDLDGDGLVDLGFLDRSRVGTSDRTTAFLSQRRPSGGVYPFGERIQHICTSIDNLQGAGSQVADFDGDGLGDLISLEGGNDPGSSTFGPQYIAHVYRGRGDGRFGFLGTNPTDCNVTHPSQDVVVGNANITNETFAYHLAAFHDVTGDGIADSILLTRDFLSVELHGRRPGDATESDDFVSGIKVPLPAFGIPKAWWQHPESVTMLFGDTDASGVDELILGVGNTHMVVDFVGPTSAGLLHSIANGVGVTTTLEYDTVANATKTSSATLPIPGQVVTKTTTTNGLTGIQSQSYTASYTYEEPLYDARDRTFVGFNKVSVDNPGDAYFGPVC